MYTMRNRKSISQSLRGTW